MSSELPHILLTFIRQKLSTYALVYKKVFKLHTLTLNLMRDIYFFTILVFNILGTTQNKKTTQTVLNVVLSIL